MHESPATLLQKALHRELKEKGENNFIWASTLASGCMLRVARELMGIPKPALSPKRRRAMEMGMDSHKRIARYLYRNLLAQDVFFEDAAYQVRGSCDGIAFFPALAPGFYALEIKTVSHSEFARIEDKGAPRDDHLRQCLINIWGLRRHYGLAIEGGIILYEDRDAFNYLPFDVVYDEAAVNALLAQAAEARKKVSAGQLPADHLPLDHWYHKYCPYLQICEFGQQAVAYQKEHRKGLTDEALARIIAERIVRRRRRKKAASLVNQASAIREDEPNPCLQACKE